MFKYYNIIVVFGWISIKKQAFDCVFLMENRGQAETCFCWNETAATTRCERGLGYRTPWE